MVLFVKNKRTQRQTGDFLRGVDSNECTGRTRTSILTTFIRNKHIRGSNQIVPSKEDQQRIEAHQHSCTQETLRMLLQGFAGMDRVGAFVVMIVTELTLSISSRPSSVYTEATSPDRYKKAKNQTKTTLNTAFNWIRVLTQIKFILLIRLDLLSSRHKAVSPQR